MNFNFGIIGGDLRYIRLAEILAKENNEVNVFGLEEYKNFNNIKNLNKKNTLEEILEVSEILIAPIPFTKDKVNLHMPYSLRKIEIEEFLIKCKNKTVLAGSISDRVKSKVKELNVNLIDLLENEELTIFNTIATAEGTIKILIENTEINLHRSKTLILGFGRVAKTLAKKLQGLDVDVTCAARKSKDLTWIETYGYKATNINELKENLYQFDSIINTVPNIILTEEKLQYVNKECLLIDLASTPGGFDKDAIEKRKLKYNWALALPGKVAPLVTAKYIKNAIYDVINF